MQRDLFGLSLVVMACLSLAAPICGSASTSREPQAPVISDRPDQMPVLQKAIPPEYPFEMRSNLLGGEVVVEFTVDALGRVKDVFTVRSSNPWFERAAIRAVEQWRFKPGTSNGRPVDTPRIQQQIVFTVDDTPGSRWLIKKTKDHHKLPPHFQWDNAPVPVRTSFPVYPFDLLRAGTPGKVRIACVVGPDGRVLRTEIQEASHPEMGLASQVMMDTWSFMPATKQDGTPCYSLLVIEHTYSPRGRDSVPVSREAREILRELNEHPERAAALQNLDKPLKPRSRRPPVFPTTMMAAGAVKGEALVEFYVDRDGDAQLPRIISSSTPEFGFAAVHAIAAWRFDPPIRDGVKAIVRVQVPVGFSLQAKVPAKNIMRD